MIKNMTFIKIGNSYNYNIMGTDGNISVKPLLNDFAKENGYTDVVSTINEKTGFLEVVVYPESSNESVNKKLVYWLKKSGWVDIMNKIEKINVQGKR